MLILRSEARSDLAPFTRNQRRGGRFFLAASQDAAAADAARFGDFLKSEFALETTAFDLGLDRSEVHFHG